MKCAPTTITVAVVTILAPHAANALQCRTASGQVFEAPAEAASTFTMAVQGCAPAVAGVEVSAPLSPLLRLFETRLPHTEIPIAGADGAAELAATARLAARVNSPRPRPRLVYRALLLSVAHEYRIDPAFLEAVVDVESGENPGARSAKGALGLMQVEPATARRFGVASSEQLMEPVANLTVGAAYLKSLQRLYGNNLPLVLAAYNAGEGAVERNGRRTPPYRETIGYVAKVLGRYRNALYAQGAGWVAAPPAVEAARADLRP